MYKTILIPLEHSAADDAILRHVRPLARLMGSRLIVVHVADGFGARNQEQLNLVESEEMVDDRAYLERVRAGLAGDGFEVSAVLECGDPAAKIVALAGAEGCDLIAMATHGHRLMMDFLLGSVADKVRHDSTVPVLLVRAFGST